MSRFGMTSLFATALLGLALGAPIVAQAQFVQAQLRSVDENPSVLTAGQGAFIAHIVGDRIDYQLTYADTESMVTQAHIHLGKPWENGGVTVFLCTNLGNAPAGTMPPACPVAPDTVMGSIVASDVQAVDPLQAGDLEMLKQAILGGAAYVNVHTETHGPGEIRGQIAPRER